MSMSRYGKMNLYTIVALPVIAGLGSIIIFGVRIDTQVFVIGTNAVPMLIGGLVSALLIRSVVRSGSDSFYLALSPTLVPAAFGLLWYLYGIVAPAADSGREYFAGPFYLLALAIGMAVIAPVGYLMTRSKKSAA
jgi:hypothetical protein